jgi:hypothetical protein
MTARLRMAYRRALAIAAVIVAAAALASGCTSPERLTSKVTPCSTKEVQIVPSEFSRNGSTTAWCAECKGRLYQCVSTADRTRAQCHLARADDVCK